MEGLPEGEYHFSTSRKIGLLLVFGMLIAIPFTLGIIQQRQPSEQYSASKCIVRPSCLDTSPTCALPEPIDGWCPPSSSSLQQNTNTTQPSTAVPLQNPAPIGDTCAICAKHNQHYLCLNQKANKAFCFAVSINAPGYSCQTCK